MSTVEINRVAPPIDKPKAQRYLAWCYECADGYRGGKAGAVGWARKHDAEHERRKERA